MIKINESNELFEMANVSKIDTKLPYDIWIDSVGLNRNTKHNSPRIKVDVEGDLIPVSIDKNPKILVSKNIPKFNIVSRWIVKYYDILMKHWNKEITDKEALNLLDEV